VEVDKKNNPGGFPLYILSSCDKTSIIYQLTTGKLDNAIQAAQFINPTLSSPVTPQTIRNMLKQNNFHSVTKTK
jgi:hypothetical protein